MPAQRPRAPPSSRRWLDRRSRTRWVMLSVVVIPLGRQEGQEDAPQDRLVVVDGARAEAAGLHRSEVVGDGAVERTLCHDFEASGRHFLPRLAHDHARQYRAYCLQR